MKMVCYEVAPENGKTCYEITTLKNYMSYVQDSSKKVKISSSTMTATKAIRLYCLTSRCKVDDFVECPY